MAKQPNLVLRGSTYYARVVVPKELRQLRKAVGRDRARDVWRSLGTGDLKQAKAKLAHALSDIHHAFDAELADLKASGKSPLVEPNPEDFDEAEVAFGQELLREDEERRASRPSGRQIEAMADDLRLNPPVGKSGLALLTDDRVLQLGIARDAAASDTLRRDYLEKDLRKHLAENEFALVDWAIQWCAERFGWRIDPDSHAYKLLGRRLIRAWLQVLEVAKARDAGQVDDEASTPSTLVPTTAHLAKRAAGTSRPVKASKGRSLLDYVDQFIREQKTDASTSALKDIRATVRQFVQLNGDLPVDAFTRDHIVAYKKALKDYPAQATKRFPGKSFTEVVKASKGLSIPKLRGASINNKLGIMSKFGQWLELNLSGFDAQSFKTSNVERTDSGRMDPFTGEEVAAILNSRAFTGAESSQNYQNPGAFKLRDWHYWLPLLAAFTGARLNELCQLRSKDIRQVDGVWVIDVSDAGGGSLKNDASARMVPIHPQLLKLGFVDYVQGNIAKGWTHVFQDIPTDAQGRRSTTAGKWFRKFLQRVGVKGDARGGMHRWRHTFADALRNAGVPEYDIAMLLGHRIDATQMTSRYGVSVGLNLSDRAINVAKIEYPNVDFGLLGDEPKS